MQVGNLLTKNAGGGQDFGRKADINSNYGRGRSGGTWFGDRFVGLAGTNPSPSKSKPISSRFLLTQ